MISYFIEFIGTFVFLSVTIITRNPFAIGMALATAIIFGNNVSDTYFNPSVTYLMFLNNNITFRNLIQQIMVQLSAAIAAFYFYSYVK